MHKPLPRFCFFTILLFTFLNAAGQKNYQPGYILPVVGDTLRGFVDDRSWARSPNAVTFRQSMQSEEIVYAPLQLRLFSVSGRIYAGAKVVVEDFDFQNRNIRTADDGFKQHHDETFLQGIVVGKKSLFGYQDGLGRQSFYIPADSGFTLLVYHATVEQGPLGKIFVESNVYRTQLYDYFNDCPAVRSKIKLLKYEQKSLQKIFQEYFKCVNIEPEYKRKKKPLKINGGIIVGISSTALKFKSGSSQYGYLTQSKFRSSGTFVPGIFLTTVLPGNFEKFSLTVELMRTIYNITTDTVRVYDDYYAPHSSNYAIFSSHIAENATKFNLLLHYRYPLRKISLFFDVGATIQSETMKYNSTHAVHYLGGVERATNDTPALNAVVKYQPGLIVSAGVALGRAALQIRLDRSEGPSRIIQVSSSAIRASIFFSYNIF